MARGRKRTIEDRATAVAAIGACGSGSAAARLLDWPVNTVNLYRRQAANDPEFNKLCQAKRLELGAKFYDLAGGAQTRLAQKLEADAVDARTLVTLMGVAFQRGDTALGLEQPQMIVLAVPDLGVVSTRLASTVTELRKQLGISDGAVIEAQVVADERTE